MKLLDWTNTKLDLLSINHLPQTCWPVLRISCLFITKYVLHIFRWARPPPHLTLSVCPFVRSSVRPYYPNSKLCHSTSRDCRRGMKFCMYILICLTRWKMVKNGSKTKFVKNEKINVVENCLKWQENWSKMSFGFFSPPPKKK